jgi:hypothetical protein
MVDPKKIHIRPLEVTTAGGAKTIARLPYTRSGVKWELPPDGAWVPRYGREGGYWRRRMAEGSCEESPAPSAPKKSNHKKGGE